MCVLIILFKAKFMSTAETDSVSGLLAQGLAENKEPNKTKVLTRQLTILADTARTLIDFSAYANTNEKFILNLLYKKLKESGSGADKRWPVFFNIFNSFSEKSIEDLCQMLEAERTTLTRYEQSPLVHEVWAEWSAGHTEGASNYFDREKLAKLMKVVKEYLAEGATASEGASGAASAPSRRSAAESGEQTVKWCEIRNQALNMNSLLGLFSFDRQGALFQSLHNRTMEVLEICKPIWDAQYSLQVKNSFNQDERKLVTELFERAFFGSRLFEKMGDFESLDLFNEFITKPPSPGAVLIFLSKYFKFDLDESMQNRNFNEDIYINAFNELLVPLCGKVCGHLKQFSQFYRKLLYQNELLDQQEAYSRLFLSAGTNSVLDDQDLGVNMWIASAYISCKLTNPKVVECIHKQNIRDNRKGLSTRAP